MDDPKEKADLDNHANQLNPNNDKYNGDDEDDDGQDNKEHDYDNDNHSNQLNPNNEEYRGK